jgi:hypothetical protein
VPSASSPSYQCGAGWLWSGSLIGGLTAFVWAGIIRMAGPDGEQAIVTASGTLTVAERFSQSWSICGGLVRVRGEMNPAQGRSPK